MRTTVASLCLLMIGLLSACSPPPSVSLSDGRTVTRDDLSEGVLLINFWAEWCAPCREEIPALNALNQAPGMTVLGIDYDGYEGEELLARMTRMGIEFSQWLGPVDAIWPVERPAGLPHTVVVVEGELRGALKGVQTRESIVTYLDSLSVND